MRKRKVCLLRLADDDGSYTYYASRMNEPDYFFNLPKQLTLWQLTEAI